MANIRQPIDADLLQHFFETSADGMMICNAQNQIAHINPAFTHITGYGQVEALEQDSRFLQSVPHDPAFAESLSAQLQQQGAWEGEVWCKRKNGEIFPAWQAVNALKNAQGIITHFLTVFRDIKALKAAETELWKLAHYDVLTGLLNRRALEQRLSEEISAAKRSNRSGVVLFFDLDDFKKINDSLGHEIGDYLLIELAIRLNTHLRHEDVFARLSGDEFVVLLTDLSENLENAAKAAGGVIKNMLHNLLDPFFIAGHTLYVSASFGVTFFHPFAQTPAEALKQADTAMYRSKKQGKNTYTFYHPAMQTAADHRLYFEAELRNAIRSNQINLAYQPQYNQHQELLGYEALVRWQHPEKGLIMPSAFIALAEETGIIIEMGEKIMQLACQQLVNWQRSGKNVPMLSINVSPCQFRHHNFVDMTLAIFQSTEVDPAKIILEVTEGLIIHDVDNVIKKMDLLKQSGVRFSIDDFGTGYSSLAYLKKMPLDQLKIDKSFIQDIAHNSSDAVIVNAIIAMANHLQLEIIAEGVENQAQINHLIQSGCNGFQGFWFSHPLQPDDIL